MNEREELIQKIVNHNVGLGVVDVRRVLEARDREIETEFGGLADRIENLEEKPSLRGRVAKLEDRLTHDVVPQLEARQQDIADVRSESADAVGQLHRVLQADLRAVDHKHEGTQVTAQDAKRLASCEIGNVSKLRSEQRMTERDVKNLRAEVSDLRDEVEFLTKMLRDIGTTIRDNTQEEN